MLYSIGKDSAVMLRLAQKAFHPGRLPFPLLHVDTTWKFREMIEFRDRFAREQGLDLIVWINPEGRTATDINPFDYGSQQLHRHHEDRGAEAGARSTTASTRRSAARAATRRRAAPRSASTRFRDRFHQWDPKNQRPELWNLYNSQSRTRARAIRVFPLSNWTELDVWQYIHLENIPIVPLYFAEERPVVERDGTLIMVDDERMPLEPGEKPKMSRVRFRTLGCYPLTGAIESDADTLPEIIARDARRVATPSGRAGSSTTTRRARWSRRSARGTSEMPTLHPAMTESLTNPSRTSFGSTTSRSCSASSRAAAWTTASPH